MEIRFQPVFTKTIAVYKSNKKGFIECPYLIFYDLVETSQIMNSISRQQMNIDHTIHCLFEPHRGKTNDVVS